MKRRGLLASTAAGLASLTGCLSEGAGGGGDAPTRTPTADPTRTDTGTPARTDTGSTPGEPDPPSTVASSWPMPAADPGHTSGTAAAAGPTAPVAGLWSVTGPAVLSAPVLADGTLYVGAGDGTVLALDARTGRRRWRTSLGAAAGTPRVLDGRLYVPTADTVVALAAGDGTEQWRVETPDRPDRLNRAGDPARAAVLVASHGVYLLSGRDDPAVVSLALGDGREQWRTAIADPWSPPVFAGDGAVYVSSGTHDARFWTLAPGTGEVRGDEPRHGNDFPAEEFYADGTVYAVDAFFGNVRATDVSGDGHSWSQGVPPGGGAAGRLSGGPEHVYYTSNADGEPGLSALSKADGTTAWTARITSTVLGRPVVASESVVVPTDGGLRAFATAGGDELWTHAAGPGPATDLAVADDLVYATSGTVLRALRPP